MDGRLPFFAPLSDFPNDLPPFYIEARQSGNTRGYKGDKATAISEYGDWEYMDGNTGLNMGLTPGSTAGTATAASHAPAASDGVWGMDDYSAARRSSWVAIR